MSFEMKYFYKNNNLSKNGEGPGGKFNGPSIKYILRDDVLSELEESLPETCSPFFNYFRSIKSLHLLCTARELEDYNLVLHDFKVNFTFLYENFGLNMPFKVHIILHHYKEYFDITNKTLRYTNGEFVESCHYSLKNEDQMHKKRTLGTPMHVKKSLKSIVWHNSRRAGYTYTPF